MSRDANSSTDESHEVTFPERVSLTYAPLTRTAAVSGLGRVRPPATPRRLDGDHPRLNDSGCRCAGGFLSPSVTGIAAPEILFRFRAHPAICPASVGFVKSARAIDDGRHQEL